MADSGSPVEIARPVVGKFSWDNVRPSAENITKSGGFGVVIKADLCIANKRTTQVAVKLLKSGTLTEKEFEDKSKNLKREVEAQVAASHNAACLGGIHGESVAWTYGIGEGTITAAWREFLNNEGLLSQVTRKESDKRVMIGIIMRWEPCSLSDALYPAKGAFPWPHVADVSDKMRVLVDIASALAILHTGPTVITHGDLKPDNILLSKLPDKLMDFKVKLTDFGLANLRQGYDIARQTTARTTTKGQGTYQYMAPEQLPISNGSGKPAQPLGSSRTTDVYAFGVLAWEILTGQKPWEGKTDVEITLSVDKGLTPRDVALVKVYPPDVPLGVQQLIESCLQRDRAKRPRMDRVRAVLDDHYRVLKDNIYDVFLSYAWGKQKESSTPENPVYERRPFAEAIYGILRNAGLKVWVDLTRMGHRVDLSMTRGIGMSKSVLVLASPEYLQSDACAFEMKTMLALNKPIVVINVHSQPLFKWIDTFKPASTQQMDYKRLFWEKVVDKKKKLFLDFHAASSLPTDSPSEMDASYQVLNVPDMVPRVVRMLQSYMNCQGVEPEEDELAKLAESTGSSLASETPITNFDGSFGKPSTNTPEEDESWYEDMGYDYEIIKGKEGDGMQVFVYPANRTLKDGFVEERHGNFDPRLCRAYCTKRQGQCKVRVAHDKGERCCKQHEFNFVQRRMWKRCIDQKIVRDRVHLIPTPGQLLAIVNFKLQNAKEGVRANISQSDLKKAAALALLPVAIAAAPHKGAAIAGAHGTGLVHYQAQVASLGHAGVPAPVVPPYAHTLGGQGVAPLTRQVMQDHVGAGSAGKHARTGGEKRDAGGANGQVETGGGSSAPVKQEEGWIKEKDRLAGGLQRGVAMLEKYSKPAEQAAAPAAAEQKPVDPSMYYVDGSQYKVPNFGGFPNPNVGWLQK